MKDTTCPRHKQLDAMPSTRWRHCSSKLQLSADGASADKDNGTKKKTQHILAADEGVGLLRLSEAPVLRVELPLLVYYELCRCLKKKLGNLG